MSGSPGGTRTLSLDPAAGGISLARLYFALLRQRFTGTLTLHQRSPAGRRTVWIRGGMPVATDWVDESAQAETPREQCMRKLIGGFAAEAVEASAELTAGEHEQARADESASINVLTLLWRGVEAHYDDARIEAELGPALVGDLVATPSLARYEPQFGFAPEDAPILAALARGVTLASLRRPGLDFGRALRIIYVLWAAQMLRLGDDAIQAIAKGNTAAAAAQQLGVVIGTQTRAQSRSQPRPRPVEARAPEPQSKPKPQSQPQSQSQPQPQSRTQSKPEPRATEVPADDPFEAGLAALEAKIAGQAHAFALFDLELDAERKQIRSAWAELSKTYHPDALEGAGRSALRGRVEQVFAALSEAYGVLSNKDQRERLRETVRAGGSPAAGDDPSVVVRNAFEAEMLARDADKLLHARAWARAAELYGRAHALSPKDSDIEAALRYAEFRRADGQPGQNIELALVQLTALITEAPACARAHYFKGLLLLGLDDSAAAKASFARAHELDPRNIDAERQLRAIKLRERGAANEDKKRGFGLRGLFKKD
jgi:tetratricopeptide (TPR) repeat protein